jgi:5-methylcytosine-specific restriction endonuclease McrA
MSNKNKLSKKCKSRMRVSKTLREFVYARDGHRCLVCGRPDNLSMDHIIPRCRGGVSKAHNLQTLCRSCNVKKDIEYTDYRI